MIKLQISIKHPPRLLKIYAWLIIVYSPLQIYPRDIKLPNSPKSKIIPRNLKLNILSFFIVSYFLKIKISKPEAINKNGSIFIYLHVNFKTGFYIGRFELNGVEKDPINTVNIKTKAFTIFLHKES